MESVLLTVVEVTQRLGCGRSKVYELMTTGDLKSVKLGRCRRVPSDELERFMTELRSSRATG